MSAPTTRSGRPNLSGSRGGSAGVHPLPVPGEAYARDEEQKFRSQLGDILHGYRLQLGILGARIAGGSFTMAASSSKTVADKNVLAGSHISLMETNAAAGTLQGSAKHLYVSARNEGVSFVVTTASGASAAGTETFGYLIIN